ncbi:uncharacterized protein LOC109833426 [Asparagus officinalis]|nr:uncharacterized protein LOC109833426 [Asparagus officinalis]
MWREMESESGAPALTTRVGDEKRMLRSFSEKAGMIRVRCRREMEDLVERMKKERKEEVGEIKEMRRVSKFSHRGRIQSMLKLRFLRKDLPFQNHTRQVSKKKAPEQPKNGATISFLRERFDNRSQNDRMVPVVKRSGTVDIEYPIDSQDSCSTLSADQFSVDISQTQEVISIGDPESLPPESTSPQSRIEELHSGSQTTELSKVLSITEELTGARCHDFASIDCTSKDLNERSQTPELESLYSRSEYLLEGSQSPEIGLIHFTSEDLDIGSRFPEAWVSNLDWQRPIESPNVHDWQSEREVVTEEHESFSQRGIVSTGHIWMGNSSSLWRGWEINDRECHDHPETVPDNKEILELLRRRRVTTTLSSDFCDKMNRVVMMLLQRQGAQYADENFSEENVDQSTWRINYEFNNADQAASDASLVPSSYQTGHYPDSWQHNLYTHTLQESESVHDLKNEISQMHQEITDLKKLLASCMEWQTKLQDYVKDEVSSAIHQSVLFAKTSDSSERTPSWKGSCCICHEMQIDSLIYRCGHMCTCFNCANVLKSSSGACPICHSSIVDVVRAYPNT